MTFSRSSKGKMAKEKGKRGERLVANFFTFRGFPSKRGVQFKGGIDSPDVICEELNFFNFEVKFVENLNLEVAYEQSRRDSKGQKIPVVIHKRSRTNLKVTLDLSHFLDMIQLIHNKVDAMNEYSKYMTGGKSGVNNDKLESLTDAL